MGHLVTQFQGQMSRAAANNRVCGHASRCGYTPTSPTCVKSIFPGQLRLQVLMQHQTTIA